MFNHTTNRAMKKLAICAAFALALSLGSCSSVRHTATEIPVYTQVVSTSTADLDVNPKKISFLYKPSKAVRRCGEKAVIETAVSEALKANGGADVLVAFQYEIKKTRNFFGRNSIKYVVVEGYPSTYTNIVPVKCNN